MRIEPVGRKTVWPVLRELLRLVEDDGVTIASPLVRPADDLAARDQKSDVMQARFQARVRTRFCLVEEQL